MNDKSMATYKTMGEAINDYISGCSHALPSRLMTGLEVLDYTTNGLLGGELIVIGARPNMGKKCLVINIAMSSLNTYSENVIVFTLDGNGNQFVSGLLSVASGMEVSSRRNDEEILEAIKPMLDGFKKMPFFLCEDIGLSAEEVYKSVQDISAKNGQIKLIIIDAIYMMQANENWNSSTSMCLFKRMAKEQNCVVIVTSEIDVKVERRPNMRPRLMDIPESMELFADHVWFLYQDWYYPQMDNLSRENSRELILAKTPDDVGLQTIDLSLDSYSSRFYDANEDY